MTRCTRREACAMGLALGGVWLAGCASGERGSAGTRVWKPWRISLAQWSLHRALFEGRLTHLEFPRAARDDFGVHAVEYVNQFWKDKPRPEGEARALRARCRDLGVASLLIMCDGEGALGAADAGERARAVSNHEKWLGAARELGCHSIRVNVAGEGTREEHAARAGEGLARLAELGDAYGLDVIVENHGGYSSDGAWLAGVIRRAGHPRCGTLPDFGNFRVGEGVEYDRYRGVEELMPFARGVSAKSHDFDDQGRETRTDYGRMLRIVRASGYYGHVGIEYEGSRLGEAEGIRATKRLLERVMDEMAHEDRAAKGRGRDGSA